MSFKKQQICGLATHLVLIALPGALETLVIALLICSDVSLIRMEIQGFPTKSYKVVPHS